MIPKIIHRTSPTKTLTPEELRMEKHLRRLLPEWEIHLWDDADNEALMALAFPEYLEAYKSIQRGVIQADIARCVYLHWYGGWYMDTDYRLLRSIGEDMLAHECILPISGTMRDQHVVCNSIMASEKGHPFWREFIDHLFRNKRIAELGEAEVEGVTGPLGLSNFYKAQESRFPGIYLPEKALFHPAIKWCSFYYERDPSNYGIHWCWGSWRGKNFLRVMKNRMTRKLTSFI